MTMDIVKAFYVLRASRKKPMTERQQTQVNNLIARYHAAVRFDFGAVLNPDYAQNGDGSDTDIEIFVRAEDSDRAASEFRACGFVVSTEQVHVEELGAA